MSYSVYLLHAKIYFIPNMFVRQIVDKSEVVHGIATIVATLILCWPFYYFIERRFLSSNYGTLHRAILQNTRQADSSRSV